jgi:HSP20 family protein
LPIYSKGTQFAIAKQTQKLKIMYKRNYGFAPRTFGGLMEDVLQNGWARVNDEVSAIAAPVNIQETDKSYDLHLIAPGLKKEDFKINIDQNTLHISFEQKAEDKEQPQDSKWLRNEYRTKSFKRSFTLNDKIETGKIAAKYADGVLVVSLPKKENSEPVAQEISVN